MPAGELRTSALTAEVTNEARAPNRANERRVCRYELASWPEFEKASAKAATIDLVTDEEVIKRAARRVLTKGQSNELVAKLKEVQAGLSEEGPDQDHERIAAIIERQSAATEAVNQFADALARSDRFKPRLDAAIARAVEVAIQTRASTIRAQAEAELSQLRPAVEAARAELHSVQQELEKARRRGLSLLDEELAATRATVEADLAQQEAAANDRLERLRREQAAVEATLASATARLIEARADAMEDFLVLQPVMQALGLPTITAPSTAASTSTEMDRRPRSEISLPAVLQSERLDRPPLDEEAYFERLCSHVEASGFNYRRYDLAAFHMAMKVPDLTILGGVSGTGKSSLPLLYAQALAGEDGGVSDRYLPVNVSPAWTNPSDLLGYVNLIDHSFSPSPSGLFSHLAQAALEYRSKSTGSGIHLICLEEMNLAQVEHYFARSSRPFPEIRLPGTSQCSIEARLTTPIL